MAVIIPVNTAALAATRTTTVPTTRSTTSTTAARTTTSTTSLTSSKPTTTSTTAKTTSTSWTSTKPTTTSTSTSSSTRSSTTSSLVSSTHSSSSVASSSSASAGLDAANAANSSSGSSGISTGVIIGIAAGGVVALVLVAVFATRAIRKSQRSARRRRSGLQAWTDRRSTLHGGADGDDDFFDPAAGAGAGGAVGAGANREKPWEMEMTPSREKLDYYGQPAGGAAGYAQGQAAYHEPRDGYASPSSAQPLVPYLTAGAYAQPQHPGMAAAYTGYPLPPVSQPVHQQYQPVQARSPSPVSPYNAPQTQGYPAAHNSFAQEMPPASGADGVPAVTLSAPQGQAGQAADEASPSVLRDGMWTVAKATFQRNLDDELPIQINDRLHIVQAFDDGWCLCEDSSHARGFVPQYCLVPGDASSPASAASSRPTISVPQPMLSLEPPTPTTLDIPHSPASSSGLISPISPGVVGMGISETLRFSRPVVLLNGQQDGRQSHRGSEVGVIGMTTSTSNSSLGKESQRSQRRSSLFVDASTAGLYLNHQNAMGL